jgi:uncharacterized protein HemX
MNRTKCNRCGLVNLGADVNCRRCGVDLHSAENAPPSFTRSAPLVSEPETPPKSPFSAAGLIVISLILMAAGYYFYTDYMQSLQKKSLVEIDQQRRREGAEIQQKNEQSPEAQRRRQEEYRQVESDALKRQYEKEARYAAPPR